MCSLNSFQVYGLQLCPCSLLSESEWLGPRITQWLLEIENEFVVAHIHLTAGIWSSRNDHNLITPNVTRGT